MGAVNVPVGWRTFFISGAEREDENIWENIVTPFVEDLARNYSPS